MKNLNKFIGIISLVAAIGFAFTACSNGSGNGGNNQTPGGSQPPTSTPLGATLNLSGQVYTEDGNGMNISYNRYNGNATVSSDIGGSGSIAGGQLSFSIGTPNQLIDISTLFDWMAGEYNNFQISNTGARGNMIEYLELSNNSILVRELQTYTSEDFVVYIYVNQDVTISADRTTDTYGSILNAFNINFKTGWNPLLNKETVSGRTNNYTFSASDPTNLRWVLY